MQECKSYKNKCCWSYLLTVETNWSCRQPHLTHDEDRESMYWCPPVLLSWQKTTIGVPLELRGMHKWGWWSTPGVPLVVLMAHWPIIRSCVAPPSKGKVKEKIQKVHQNTISSSNGSTAIHSLVHVIIFVVFNAHTSNTIIHCYLALSNAYICNGMLVRLKVLEYTPIDLIGYNCLGVISVDIHQRPQFTFFAIALECTQPELPLVSPLILWCVKHQRMFFALPGLMPGFSKSFLLFSQRLMKAFLPSSLRLYENKKCLTIQWTCCAPYKNVQSNILSSHDWMSTQKKLPQQRTDVHKKIVDCSQKTCKKIKWVFQKSRMISHTCISLVFRSKADNLWAMTAEIMRKNP